MSSAAQDLARWRDEHHPRVDLEAAEGAAADLLAALGLDLADESTRETPGRMARAFAEMLSPVDFEMTTFPNDEGYDELVLVQDIPVRSLCEHHMLPFVGIAHVGYLPGERILGLSKLARTVDLHSRGAQTQERLTQRVAEHLRTALGAKGVGVVVAAEHTLHDAEGCPGTGHPDGDVGAARPAAGRPRDPRGVPGADPDREGDEMTMVIVGGGLAGASAVEELRDQGYDGDLVLIGAEEHLPYHRPPLSKEVLLGDKDADGSGVHDAGWYADRSVDVRTGTTGAAHRPAAAGRRDRRRGGRLRAAAARHGLRAAPAAGRGCGVPPDTGRRAGPPGRAARAAADADRRRGLDRPRGRGGRARGRLRGHRAGAQAQPLLGVVGARVGAVFADLHRAHGVDLRLGTSYDGAAGARTSCWSPSARCRGPTSRATPDSRSATACSSTPTLRTSDPAILAAGDVAAQDHPALGRLRVEHWDNAIDQGRAAARTMLGGTDAYDRTPYFFTDQYDLGTEYVGHVPREHLDDVVVRGDLAERRAVVFWQDGDGLVLGGMHVNEWDAADELRELVGQRVDPARLLAQLSRRTT